MKKGIMISTLVGILALVTTLLVIISIALPPIKEALMSQGTKGQCQYATLLSGLTTIATIGFGKIEPHCLADRVTITKEDVEAYDFLASKAVSRYQEEGSRASLYFPMGDYGARKWTVHRIVANKLGDCYDRGWRGQLDYTSTGWATEIFDETGAFLCILCSRIKYDRDLVNSFPAGDRSWTMSPWLDAENRGGTTYSEFLTSGTKPFYQYFIDNARIDLEETQAIVFFTGIHKDQWSLNTYGAGGVGIFDYDQLTTDLGWDSIKRIPGFFDDWWLEQENAHCATIVGDY